MTGAGSFCKIALDGVTADETPSPLFDCIGCTHLAVYVLGVGTTSGGVLTVEEAVWDDDKQVDKSATWSSITTINASDASAGVYKAVHLTVAGYGFVRVRVSTAISGGGVIYAWLVGAP
jgi:hypothetical protein